MMIALFLMILIAMTCAIFHQRKAALFVIFFNLGLMLLMLWHHVTTVLHLNF
ncbi:MAG: DUF5993 family protein [Simkaniaceae bacterium]|nr:DUF5993 family protein [Simkaniaceae bacterium]MCF7852110.1 DUF5993 family protein [Simkaniaceae bacterium]